MRSMLVLVVARVHIQIKTTNRLSVLTDFPRGNVAMPGLRFPGHNIHPEQALR